MDASTINPTLLLAKAKKAATRDPWREQKEQAIIKALLMADGKTVAAAKILGVSRAMMYRYRKQLGI